MGSQNTVVAVGEDAAQEAGLLPVLPAYAPFFAAVRRRFLDAIPIAGAVLSTESGTIELVDCNEAFARAQGQPDTVPLIERGGFGQLITDFLEGDKPIHDFEWSDGGPIAGRHYSVRLARLEPIGRVRRCLLTLLDRTAERCAEKSLRLEMFNDSLTGLPNRAGFSDRLEGLIEKAEPGSAAVLIVDLTRFSRINESIGAVAGDELLITVARRLLSTMRAGDILARTGGNEFGVFVRVQDGPEEVMAVAQRLSAVLVAPCRLSDLEIRIDCAVGCAVSDAGCDADELIRRAQFALKRAKASGNAELYQPRAFDIARQQFTIETSLRRAIEAKRLTMAFQPVIDLATGRICAFEALARWREEGADVPPSIFIPVAEESGLILPLGRWAMNAALQALKSWDRAAGRPVGTRMAVNVSAIQVARDDVPGIVTDALAATGIEADRLVLELTESAIVADPERAMLAMEAVRAIGATIALDDFGTGYSNLGYLQRLPIDMLKIDQSFVTGMLGDRDKVSIVRAVLSLADALGIKTTAEGVETLELSQTLAALGCTRAQGYFYAPPLDAEAAFEFWSRSNSAAT